jgi:hypothetical protein
MFDVYLFALYHIVPHCITRGRCVWQGPCLPPFLQHYSTHQLCCCVVVLAAVVADGRDVSWFVRVRLGL